MCLWIDQIIRKVRIGLHMIEFKTSLGPDQPNLAQCGFADPRANRAWFQAGHRFPATSPERQLWTDHHRLLARGNAHPC